MLIPDRLPRLTTVMCRTCHKDFETNYIQTNECDICKQKNVVGPKPLNKDTRTQPPSKLLSMKDFEPEVKTLIESLWIRTT